MLSRECGAKPPHTARKPNLVGKLLRGQNHVIIKFSRIRVIIPIYHRDIRRNLFDNLLWEIKLTVDKITAVGKTEKHILPHHRLIAVFTGDFANLIQMPEQKRISVAEAVFVQIFAESHAVRLIHPDVDSTGTDASRKGRKHMVDQLIGSVVIQKKNIVAILNLPVFAPAERRIQMRQRLNARDKLDSDGSRIIIELAQLRGRITTALIAEIRLLFHLIRILGIEHRQIVSHL